VKRIKHHQQLRERIVKGMDSVSDAYQSAMLQTISEPYQWPDGFGVTHRRNGEVVVGSNRNIVDLGNLKNSQTMFRQGLKTTYEWSGMGETPPVIVHEGATLANGTQIPPRRWTEVAVDKVDWQGLF
jgi:hypothetical protein